MNKCVKKCKQVFSSAPIPPSAIVEEACFKIGLPPNIQRAAKTTADNFSKHALCEGKRPQTVAGASMYLVCQNHAKYKNDPTILEKISEKVGIAEQTIVNTYNVAHKEKEKLLPEYMLVSLPTFTGGPQ